MIEQVIVKATGGWGFHFGVTESQARQIISAPIGAQICLNGPGEVLTMVDDETISHFMRKGPGATSEDLVRKSVLAKLQEMIDEDVWSAPS